MPNLGKNRYLLGSSGLLFCALALGICWPVDSQADDSAPFQVEQGRWMSLDYYKESIKNTSAFQGEQPKTRADVPDILTPPTLAAKPQEVASTASVAMPTRPLDIPLMPGMNKAHYVPVESTVKEKLDEILQPQTAENRAAFELPSTRWQSAADLVNRKDKGDDNAEDDGDNKIMIRMTYLPDSRQIPVPSPERIRTQGRVAANTPLKTEAVKKPPVDLAACAAVDSYKKKQLEAIQSDRETLKALQTAISQLGLQKELSFITGAQSNVATASGGDTNSASEPQQTMAR